MRCCVPGCKNDSRNISKSQGITFHVFPNKPSLRTAWLRAIGKLDWKPKERCSVCSDHFLYDDLYEKHSGLRKVRSGAVPVVLQNVSCDFGDSARQEVCRVCLTTDSRMYTMKKYKLHFVYEHLTGVSLKEDKLPQSLCAECAHRLLAFRNFKSKSLRANRLLDELVSTQQTITIQNLKSINREIHQLVSSLSNKHFTPDHCDFYFEHTEEPIEIIDLDLEIKNELDIFEEEYVQQDIGEEMNGEEAVDEEAELAEDDADQDFAVSDKEFSSDDSLPLERSRTKKKITIQNLKSINRKIHQLVSSLSYKHFTPDHCDFYFEHTEEPEIIDLDLEIKNELDIFEEEYVQQDIGEEMNGEEAVDEEAELAEDDADQDFAVSDKEFSSDDSLPLERSRTKKKAKETQIIPSQVKQKKCKGKKHKEKSVEKEREQKTRREKELKTEIPPITGPFECLQPSAVAADGTCHQTFSSCCEYSAHVRDEHSRLLPRRLSCQVCEKPLAGGHNRAYSCKVCGAGFDSGNALLTHQEAHEKHPFVCDICDKQFTHKSSIIRHMLIHTDDRPFKCKYCKKAFNRKSSLNHHVLIHTKEKPHRCVVCSKTFSHPAKDTPIIPSHNCKEKKEKEKKHKKKGVEEIQQYVCYTGAFECLQHSFITDGTCHQTFSSCCEYSAHVREMHNRRRKDCQVCEKPLAAGEDRAHSCKVCGARFDSGEALLKHQEAHEKQPFVCNICYKQFTRKSNLERHMRIHTGDRPFKCKYCKKSFTQSSILNRHELIHTKVKPHRCVVCSKTFNQSFVLRRHMRTHTQVSPFQCVLCQQRFTRSAHLKNHLKTHITVS